MNLIDTHYAGRRMSLKDGALYVYEREDGEGALVFGKNVARVGIGTQVTFVESPEGGFFVGGEHAPKIGHANDVSEQKLIEWNAHDRVCVAELAEIARARKTKRETVDPLAEAIAVLRAALDTQRGFSARAALWRHIEQEVNS